MPSGRTRTGSERLATKLRSLRGGLTQADAAQRAGISEATWQNLERSMTRGQPATLRRIADGFGMTFEELWSYVEDRPLAERFTAAELDELAKRLAPLLAVEIRRLNSKP